MCIYIRVWQILTLHGIGMYAYTTVIHTKWCRQQSFLNYLVQGHCKDIALGPQDAPNRPPRGPQDVAKCTGPADAQKIFVQLLGLVIAWAQQMHKNFSCNCWGGWWLCRPSRCTKFFRAIAGAGDCHPVNLCMHFGGFSRKKKANNNCRLWPGWSLVHLSVSDQFRTIDYKEARAGPWINVSQLDQRVAPVWPSPQGSSLPETLQHRLTCCNCTWELEQLPACCLDRACWGAKGVAVTWSLNTSSDSCASVPSKKKKYIFS